MEHLERYGAAVLDVLGEIDGRHAAVAELARDGGRLYYIERRVAGRRLMAARIASGSVSRVLSREVVLDPVHAEPVANHANWDVTPDGRFILVEPVAGNRFLMVSDWPPRGVPARR